MWKRIGKIFFIIISIIIFSTTNCFAAPEVKVSVDQQEVLLGDSVILTINVQGVDNPQAPELPAMNDFIVKFRGVSRRSFSSYTVIIQGKTVQQQNAGGGYNFDYELIPKKSGVFLIPSFEIVAGGKSFRTTALQIRVTEESQQSEEIFVNIDADKNNVYLGEKILLTFKWYIKQDIQSYVLQIPWLEGLKNFLITDPLPDENIRYERLLVNNSQPVLAVKTREFYKGQDYTVVSFQKILTPISTGEYTLEPVFVKCNIITGYKRSRRQQNLLDNFFDSGIDDFFNLGRDSVVESFSTRSRDLKLFVNEVPQENQPPNYQGAVGEFDFDVSISPLNLKAGEPITLTMKVTGAGNFDQVILPEITGLSAFKSYEPESKTNIVQESNTLVGDKVFEKVLIPKIKGDYTIDKIGFTFFNPKLKQYQTINRGPFTIHVEASDQAPEVQVIALAPENSSDSRKKDLKILERDIRYIKTNPGTIDQRKKQFYENPAAWVIGYLFPLVLMLGLKLWQTQRQKLKTDTGFARYRRAYKIARKNLQTMQKILQAQDKLKFYDFMSKTLNTYLADKLNKTTASIGVETIAELEQKGLSSPQTAGLNALYQTFEMALFSSVQFPEQKLKADLQILAELIDNLERIL
ncbi:MAG: BatD family protein [Candidatus Omnitrophota bacterium]